MNRKILHSRADPYHATGSRHQKMACARAFKRPLSRKQIMITTGAQGESPAWSSLRGSEDRDRPHHRLPEPPLLPARHMRDQSSRLKRAAKRAERRAARAREWADRTRGAADIQRARSLEGDARTAQARYSAMKAMARDNPPVAHAQNGMALQLETDTGLILDRDRCDRKSREAARAHAKAERTRWSTLATATRQAESNLVGLRKIAGSLDERLVLLGLEPLWGEKLDNLRSRLQQLAEHEDWVELVSAASEREWLLGLAEFRGAAASATKSLQHDLAEADWEIWHDLAEQSDRSRIRPDPTERSANGTSHEVLNRLGYYFGKLVTSRARETIYRPHFNDLIIDYLLEVEEQPPSISRSLTTARYGWAILASAIDAALRSVPDCASVQMTQAELAWSWFAAYPAEMIALLIRRCADRLSETNQADK